MTIAVSRRGLLHHGSRMAALIGASAVGPFALGPFALGPFALGPFASEPAFAQTASSEPKQDLYYRDDWFGEPWRKPETAILIHGNDESSVVWYAWMPQMAREFRIIRPDMPGFGRSKIPAGFEWSLPNLATYVAHVMDKAGINSAHIVGAKTGGAIAMQFAADYPKRTRTLSVASGPASVIVIEHPSKIPQHDRLGTAASKEMVAYWNTTFANAPQEGVDGLHTALSKFDLARDGVLQRIAAPTLVMTADRSALQSVEKVRRYQAAIPKSRLVVINSDAYHIAAANADECVTNVLAFIKETRQKT